MAQQISDLQPERSEMKVNRAEFMEQMEEIKAENRRLLANKPRVAGQSPADVVQ